MRILPNPESEQPIPLLSAVKESLAASMPMGQPTHTVATSADVRPGWTEELSQQVTLLEGELHAPVDQLAQTVAQQMHTLLHSTQHWEEGQRQQLLHSLDHLKAEWHEELQSLERLFREQCAQWSSQLKEKDMTIEKLALELNETRNWMETQVRRADTISPTPIPAEIPPALEVPASVLPFSDDKPEASLPQKVAFFSKLWNYLNQSAIEIPRRRQD